MEKLWSPWRSNYIQSFKDKKETGECVFCNAESSDINSDDSLIVRKNKFTFTMLNLYPYNSGHIMIIPYRHVSDILQITHEENLEIMNEVQNAVNALTHFAKPQGFNIGANIGKAAGAGIDQHIHFHVLPRWNGDTNFMPAIGQVKVISQDLLETKKKFDESVYRVGIINQK